MNSVEYAEQTRIAIELFAIGGLILLGLLVFLLRRSAWPWGLVVGMQVAVFLLAAIEGALTDIGWFFFSSLPLLTLFLLLGLRKADGRLKPSLAGNLTPHFTR